jgi:hypothetical protein
MSLELTNVDQAWNSVAMSGWDLSNGIESHGWHCMWLATAFSRVSLGRTAETATTKVVKAGLDALSTSFNAAEIESLRVASYRGFSVARVTIHARHIQQGSSLSPWSVRRKELDGN